MADTRVPASEALRLLLERLRTAAPELAREAELAINQGKDLQIPEKRRGRTVRVYRKAVPLNDVEAFRAALNVLRAHFIEQPVIAQSAVVAIEMAGLGSGAKESRAGRRVSPPVDSTVRTTLEFEVAPETQISSTTEPVFRARRVDEGLIREQTENLEAVLRLVDGV